ncbi:hypothetical protein KY304_01635 [Candidatus Woesearchaeota archaeon]|nr:hypothetical protein [Candidatus Woesearchaeota archaeon]MBW2978790.1 hypothetical protein [Candidatus Woesearchaeota archaeon]
MKRKNLVIGVIGAMILIAMIFALVSLMSDRSSIQNLIHSTIKLRDNIEDPVVRAKAITDINSLVQELDNSGINEGWRAMAVCIPEGCSDDEYMNFIISAINEYPKDIEHGYIVKEIIKVHRFWGDSANVIEFSESLTESNKLITELHSSKAANLWNDIVSCNGECEEFDNLFFEMIGVIVEL